MKRLYNPEIFQGRHKHRNYFEGWYYKLIDESKRSVMAIIPGIAIGKSKEDAHSFIQVIDSKKGSVHYFKYPMDAFNAHKDKLYVEIDGNEFSSRGIKLQLQNNKTSITGQIDFYDIVPFPKTALHPGIMGPFSFIPWMECYHGVVNIHQKLRGSLSIEGSEVSFDGGEGYVEKDWGRSFPEAWIWVQANHFDDEDTSFMFSIAKIPWLGSSFIGFISFVKVGDKIFNLATYNRSKILEIELKDRGVQATIQSLDYLLHFEVDYPIGSILKAPKNGIMEDEIEESISGEVKLLLRDRKGYIIFDGESSHSGVEISKKARILTGH